MNLSRGLTFALAISILLATLPIASGDDISSPSKIPKFGDFTTPVLAPGESGDLNFTIQNRYSGKLLNLTLAIEIYKYATLSESKVVNAQFPDPPRISYMGREYGTKLDPPILVGSLVSGVKIEVRFTIHTSKSTPHGSLFDNAAYFVRTSIVFEYTQANVTSSHKMMSRGYFSDPDWENATRGGGLNITYLRARYGVDAIVPETSFTVREPIPSWPLYILIGLAALFGVLAIVFYMHETHGYFPTLDKRLQQWSGKLRKGRRPPKKRKDEP
jgi:hypothetical protein